MNPNIDKLFPDAQVTIPINELKDVINAEVIRRSENLKFVESALIDLHLITKEVDEEERKEEWITISNRAYKNLETAFEKLYLVVHGNG